MLDQQPEQGVRKAEVALHELFLFLGAVHARQMIDKLAVRAVTVQKLHRGIGVEKENVLIAARMQRGDQVFPDESAGARDQNLHIRNIPLCSVPSVPVCLSPIVLRFRSCFRFVFQSYAFQPASSALT